MKTPLSSDDVIFRLRQAKIESGESLRQLRREAAEEIERLRSVETNLRASFSDHCSDCCCARSWKALRVTTYTGLSIPEHIESLRNVLERYMFAYPAFRMKPIGAPGSQARIESERLMGLEEQAQRVLAGGKP